MSLSFPLTSHRPNEKTAGWWRAGNKRVQSLASFEAPNHHAAVFCILNLLISSQRKYHIPNPSHLSTPIMAFSCSQICVVLLVQIFVYWVHIAILLFCKKQSRRFRGTFYKPRLPGLERLAHCASLYPLLSGSSTTTYCCQGLFNHNR